MMRTLFSGILGLRVHQSEMDVIGNNVANVNTYGFKRGRTVFQDILSQTEGFSTAPTGARGGINATQIGLGVRLSSVDNVFTQGALQSTGRANDIAIEGDGFFVVKDGDRALYTRAGTLDIDANGNMIHAGTGFLLQGYAAREDQFTKDLFIDRTQLRDINLATVEKLSARATSEVVYKSNLKASATERNLPASRVMSFTDAVGNYQELEFRYIKVDKNTWNWIAIDDTEGQIGNGVLVFDDNGKIISSTGGPILSYDPDGAAGSPPKLTFQQNNTAGISSVDFVPLTAETWTQQFPFLLPTNQPIPSDTAVLSSLRSNNVDQFPNAGFVDLGQANRFDLTKIDDQGNQRLVFSGFDGNGDFIDDKVMTLNTRTTIADIVQFIGKSFPNCIASFNPNTGAIEVKDASPGVKKMSSIKMEYIDQTMSTTFPGLITTPTRIQNAQLELWSMNQSFRKNGTIVTSGESRLTDLFDDTNTDFNQRFDLRNAAGTTLTITGRMGDAAQTAVGPVNLNITATTTINEIVGQIRTLFAGNAHASYNPRTGMIEMRSADGEPNVAEFSLAFNPGATGATFPGHVLAQLTSRLPVDGTNRLVQGQGTVKDGVHSITIKRIDATPSLVTGGVTGLTRFTTFAELDIGTSDGFMLSIDNAPPQRIDGLATPLPATHIGRYAVTPPLPADPLNNIPAFQGSVTINGYPIVLQPTPADIATQDAWGEFVARAITTTFDPIAASVPDKAIFAQYDQTTKKLYLEHRSRGTTNMIDVNSFSSNQIPLVNVTGLEPNDPVARGTDGATIGQLIDAVNNQVPGAVMEIQGDRIVVKRAVDGANFNIRVTDNIGTPRPAYPSATNPYSVGSINQVTGISRSTYSIAERVFGQSNPITTPGSDMTYTLIDQFTSNDGQDNFAMTYTDFRPGQTIGNDQIGKLVISSNGFQPGTCTIITTGERDAGDVRISVPTVNAYSADFAVQTGGTPITNVKVAMIPGEKHVASTTVYDSIGNAHIVNMTFEKVEPNKWQYAVALDPENDLVKRYFETHPYAGDAPTDLEMNFAADAILGNRRGVLIFNEFGKIDENKTSSFNAVNLPDLVKPLTFDPADAQRVTVMPDFTGVTQFDAGFSTAARSQNGYEMGVLRSFEITNSGIIVGSYTNGYKRDIGQVVVANFTNPAGLEKESDSMYAKSANSGEPLIGQPGTGGRGIIQSQTLEMANVDLAREFTDMIVAQRGFQANARTITTADQFLQELINLKR